MTDTERRAACQGVVPPFLLERIAEQSSRPSARLNTAADGARRTLAIDSEMRDRRVSPSPRRTAVAAGPGGLTRTIADAQGKQELPGVAVRSEGDPDTGDAATDESYVGLGDTYTFFRDVYDWSSLDNKGLPLDATVHYGQDYDNAFWDGERMVFGDGDGEVFTRFTVSVGVIAHELTHGFTQFTSRLEYVGQSGALNESVSDVFGAMVEQYAKKQTAADASWLVGEGLFLPAVQGRALRSMLEPGTAYDDDVLGKDPQPADMAGYVETTEDNGGVHINSGIPNRAFAVAAQALGGSSWERAGRVWFDTLTSGTLSPTVDFAGFADATLTTASTLFGTESDVHRAISGAWSTVGVDPADSATGLRPSRGDAATRKT
jgi:Zn-dependent metalloprotease